MSGLLFRNIRRDRKNAHKPGQNLKVEHGRIGMGCDICVAWPSSPSVIRRQWCASAPACGEGHVFEPGESETRQQVKQKRLRTYGCPVSNADICREETLEWHRFVLNTWGDLEGGPVEWKLSMKLMLQSRGTYRAEYRERVSQIRSSSGRVSQGGSRTRI